MISSWELFGKLEGMVQLVKTFFSQRKVFLTIHHLKVFPGKLAQCVWYSNLSTSSNAKMESNVEN